MVMDFDQDWSINFWMIQKQMSSHGSLRRSVIMPVYSIKLTETYADPGTLEFLRSNLRLPMPQLEGTNRFEFREDVDMDNF